MKREVKIDNKKVGEENPKYINIAVGRKAKEKIYYDDWITWDKI